MLEQTLNEGQIRSLVDLLQYHIEIADRLVPVDQENETELTQCRTPRNWPQPSYCGRQALQRSN